MHVILNLATIGSASDTSNWLPNIISVIIGGLLSIFGAFLAANYTAKKRLHEEISYVVINIGDELDRIVDIFNKMRETGTKKGSINAYFEQLKTNTEAYQFHRQKLYIIHSQPVRKDIVEFYRLLSDFIAESNKVVLQFETPETDQPTRPTNDHHNATKGIIDEGENLKKKAEGLKMELGKYSSKN